MKTKWDISTPPATEPVTAAEVEAALRLSSGFDSATVTRQIEAARDQVEIDLDRSLITRTITLKLDKWPESGIIHLPKPPFLAITSFKYIDADEAEQTLVEDTDYTFKELGDSGRLVVTPGGSWPTVLDGKEVIEVIYTAGYGASASDVPGNIRELVVKQCQIMYSNGALDDMIYKKMADKAKFYFDYTIND